VPQNHFDTMPDEVYSIVKKKTCIERTARIRTKNHYFGLVEEEETRRITIIKLTLPKMNSEHASRAP
jgi:hypothetical protein